MITPTPDAVVASVLAWLQHEDVLNLEDAQVIRGDVAGPRPPLPYLTVALVADVGIGQQWTVDAGTEEGAEQRVYGEREATISVQAYGNSALEWLASIESVAWTDDANAAAEAADFSIRSVGAIRNVVQTVDTGREPRKVLELVVGYQTSLQPREVVPFAAAEVEVVLDSAVADDLTVTITAPLES